MEQRNLETNVIGLVSDWFSAKTDKQGNPYINHLTNVRDNIAKSPVDLSSKEKTDARIVALLHDTIEDTSVTANDLLCKYSIPSDIVDAVQILTRDRNMTYIEYINSVCTSGNKLAIAVKIADLTDNLSKCVDNTRFKTLERRYRVSIETIMSRCNSMILPGKQNISVAHER